MPAADHEPVSPHAPSLLLTTGHQPRAPRERGAGSRTVPSLPTGRYSEASGGYEHPVSERSPAPRRAEGDEMPDVNVYVERPAEKEHSELEDLQAAILQLEHVTSVDVNPPGNVVAVSYTGGRSEQQEIERAVEGAGYGISRLSVRSDFPDGREKLWDI